MENSKKIARKIFLNNIEMSIIEDVTGLSEIEIIELVKDKLNCFEFY